MTLDEVVAERYRDFISIEDILHSIADKYQCSPERACLVLADALSFVGLQGTPGLYERGELAPRSAGRQGEYELPELLKEKRLDAPARAAYQRYLCRRDEVGTRLAEAGFPIVEAPSPAHCDINTLEHDAHLVGLEKELAEAKAEIERLKAGSPLFCNELLKIVIEVQHKYGHDCDPETGSGWPKRDLLIDEIREKCRLPDGKELSKVRAKAVEAMACPVIRRG